ncbi:hypothetical protein ACQ4PT_002044 [Festuca glaucescens]
MDALQAVHGASGLGMPPPEKFRSGPLPLASVPLCASASSASDMDESSDVEEEVEVCSGRYSVDSSPASCDDLPHHTAVPLCPNVPGQQ